MNFSTMKVPFSMDSDVEGLVRCDHEQTRPAVDRDTYLQKQCTTYGLVVNCWCLYALDNGGYDLAIRIETMLRQRMALSEVIALCTDQADKLRCSKPTDDWVATAVAKEAEVCGNATEAKANVIRGLSFAKRFSPGVSNNIQSNPIQVFRQLQHEMRKARPTVDHGIKDGPNVASATRDYIARTYLQNRYSSFFYRHVIERLGYHISQLIGDGPDETLPLPEVMLSKGSSRVDLPKGKASSTRNVAEKIALCSTVDPNEPNFEQSHKYVRVILRDATYSVSVWNLDHYTIRSQPANYNPWSMAAAAGLAVSDPLVIEYMNSLQFDYEVEYNTCEDLECFSHSYARGRKCFTFGQGPDFQRAQKERYEACQFPEAVVSGCHCKSYNVYEKIYVTRDGHTTTMIAVPKSFNKLRGISMDTACRMSRQLRVKEQLAHALRRNPVLGIFLNLEDQSQNQELARIGAQYGEFATTDVTAASDAIALSIARDVFPGGWLRVFLDTRPTHFSVGSEAPMEMFTFAPMGCGWTFHMESVFYCALAMTAYDIAEEFGVVPAITHMPKCFVKLDECITTAIRNGDRRVAALAFTPGGHVYLVSVYGDDVVLPCEIAAFYLGLCDYLGIKANEEKTFMTGYFRESCGGDWLGDGSGKVYNATPVYWPRSATTCFEYDSVTHTHKFTNDAVVTTWNGHERVETTELSKLIALQHALWDASPSACAFLTDYLQKLVPEMTASSAGSDCTDLWATVDHGVPAIFDEFGVCRPLRVKESYLTVTDPDTGKGVDVNARMMHLAPKTHTLEARKAVTSADLSEKQIDTSIEMYIHEQKLCYGGRATEKVFGVDIMPEIMSRAKLTNESVVRWELI